MAEHTKNKVPLPPRAKKIVFFVVVMVVFVVSGIYFSQAPSTSSLPTEMHSSNLTEIDGARRATNTLNTPEMRDREIKADNKAALASQGAGQTSIQPIEDRGSGSTTEQTVVGFDEFDGETSTEDSKSKSPPPQPVPVAISRPLTEQEHLDLQNKRNALRAKIEGFAAKSRIHEASLMQNGNGHIPVVITPQPSGTSPSGTPGGADQSDVKPIIRAGELLPGSLNMHGDTDSRGVMRATILSGDHAGVALLGTVSSNALGDILSINFNRGAFKKKTVAISAIALTADASSQDVATFVDRKYLERFVLSPIGAATESIASTLGQKPTSTSISVGGAVTQSNTGLSSADVARIAAAKALQEVSKTTDVSKKPVAYVEPTEKSNKLITIMFLEDVFL